MQYLDNFEVYSRLAKAEEHAARVVSNVNRTLTRSEAENLMALRAEAIKRLTD